jgi:hypothetical protein
MLLLVYYHLGDSWKSAREGLTSRPLCFTTGFPGAPKGSPLQLFSICSNLCISAVTHQADFSYWRDSEQAKQFRTVFQPVVLTMEFRLPELENPARQHGVTLGQIVERRLKVPELQRASLVIRAQSYRRRIFQEIDKARGLLLP